MMRRYTDFRGAVKALPPGDEFVALGLPAQNRGGAVLEFEGVSHFFGDFQVLRSIDLSVDAGERVAVRGPNGSGKTTLLRCVAGTLRPTQGSVAVGGYPAGSFEAGRLTGASLSQERSFYLRLSGRANLILFARLRHASTREAKAQVRALEEELELSEIADRRVDKCSTGMVQQLAVARALLGDPAVLVLDEPTGSLDAGAVGRFWATLERRPDLSVLLATHRADDLDHCTRRIDLAA
jgi:ABC-type multidrug transport system ATPase subunit